VGKHGNWPNWQRVIWRTSGCPRPLTRSTSEIATADSQFVPSPQSGECLVVSWSWSCALGHHFLVICFVFISRIDAFAYVLSQIRYAQQCVAASQSLGSQDHWSLLTRRKRGLPLYSWTRLGRAFMYCKISQCLFLCEGRNDREPGRQGAAAVWCQHPSAKVSAAVGTFSSRRWTRRKPLDDEHRVPAGDALTD
jgi:hypothetical protein